MRIARRAVLALPLAAPAAAQSPWPDRTIRLVTPYVAGGSVDLLARAVAQALQRELGQSVLVENRPGGTTVIGTSFAARAAPDGYTLLVGGSSVQLNRFLMANLPYDPDRDFAAVLQLADVPYVLVAHAGLPWRSLGDVIAAARAHPGQVTYASFGIGGEGHLCGALLGRMSGTDLLHIPYPGNPPALIDVAAGRVNMMFCTIPVAQPEIQAGHVRPLAVSSATRVPALPAVPTVAEAGLPGYEATGLISLYAPRAVPGEIVAKLHAATRAAMARPEFREAADRQGFMLAAPRDPEATEQHLRAHAARWEVVIREMAIRL
jgi:tripartite-type tricarboxylate transporter receptor subunit TctC